MSSDKCSDPCKPQACLIQDCLKANNYNESKCTALIDLLYLCCKSFYEANGPTALTVCCPKLNLLTLKLRQRELGKVDAELLENHH
ncbi:hypothetical protein BABINDRAFT_159498 [Babjeviella inositovora NRRL Y-12698]|uniref:Cx9C motif-containing protein 4, mitochondrial n=1 Tax=Babjeviella inositovora NRRL Y-12698 TaxID=984486 RepID=A0A1E3QZQ1_9ASCO|nr:uncharacterized protein BABINDRAFT_159498 [Babjeviella inositovora NRRL Y-12698]ODQ83024.1 hypothetical protein BABINDRAFT_159498 [Babjeviella inositovora NRRL Y-12698]